MSEDREPQLERLRLEIAYDGRGFAGWQSQAKRDGVQDAVEAAVGKVAGVTVRVHGSGRTDSGVHALAQVAHVDVPAGKQTLTAWFKAVNANLPPLVRVRRVTRVPGGREGFHARFDACGKRYEYRIRHEPWLHPLEIGRAWHVPGELDLDRVRAAAELLVGKHDFAAFAANRGHEVTDTVRTIFSIRVSGRSPLITLRFEGDGFLYKMVRMLTGTIVRVGQGKAELSFIRNLLEARRNVKTNFAAPADGLYLAKVFYGEKRER